MNKSFFKIIIPILSFGLSGCGGSEDASQEVVINAYDTVKFAALNTKTVVDLRQRVKAENSEPLLLSDVKKINGDCDILSVDGLSFNIYARDADVCMFEYSVTPAPDNYTGNAKAVAQVVANTNPEQGGFLPPLSRTMEKNGETKFVSSNLITEAGYVLDVDSLVLLNGSGTNEIGEVLDKSESGFTYKAPNSETIVRIYYSAINKTNNTVKPGIIYIAVGQNSNTYPTAQDRQLPPKAFADGASVINIEKSWLHDVEDDELQLVYANGNIGDTKITADLQLEYKPSGIGSENIVYIVTDHNGGYGIGVLSFKISSYQPVFTLWKTVLHPPLTLYDPQLASSAGMNFETGQYGQKNYYPTFNHSLAKAYCETNGQRLPTPDELKMMWNFDLDKEPIFTAKNNKYKWHSSKNYLTNNPLKQVSLITGQEIDSKEGDTGYFSCIESTEELEWQFATDFINTELGNEEQIFEINKDPTTGNIAYRDPDDYQLELKVNKWYLQGVPDHLQPDPKELDISINKNMIRIDSPFGKENQYIKAEVTDKSALVKGKVYINIGINQCAKGTTPEQALLKACIATVRGINTHRRWTLAIPISQLPSPIPQDLDVQIFDNGGRGFIGTFKPNTQIWQDYVRPACEAMNNLKMDGRTNWAPSVTIVGPEVGDYQAKDHTNEEDRISAAEWSLFMARLEGGGSVAMFGQGYAGLVGEDWIINQDGATAVYQAQPQGSAYTFASCVSERR